jgi:hypothetical protein
MTRCHAHRTADGREILSDVVMRQGDQVLHHIHTTVDAHGHIQDLWQIEEKRPARQLAKYFYVADERRAVAVEAGGQQGRLHPVGDLLTAQEENGQPRLYQYRNHLLTRYTDRTERGMNPSSYTQLQE